MTALMTATLAMSAAAIDFLFHDTDDRSWWLSVAVATTVAVFVALVAFTGQVTG